ncbi:hypothetical protein K504DRAFT_506385 [Pleomassaria siparia CBS 279.74]|uniref:Uncharacterized protein n=1 Tax=Pleomassaria siparia CBS 279.74 TaxID=1314801 RepID=A0A6G1JWC8_9PLEO|nr:hypothetical protein K504DRAFT_506385 [Pleomassaria siparia CBS 279.74]
MDRGIDKRMSFGRNEAEWEATRRRALRRRGQRLAPSASVEELTLLERRRALYSNPQLQIAFGSIIPSRQRRFQGQDQDIRILSAQEAPLGQAPDAQFPNFSMDQLFGANSVCPFGKTLDRSRITHRLHVQVTLVSVTVAPRIRATARRAEHTPFLASRG